MIRKKKERTEDITCEKFLKIEKGKRFPEVTEEQKKQVSVGALAHLKIIKDLY